MNVFGRVEGELHASIVRISDGAEVEGTIAAQELTIGGRFKGTIQADRVMLTSSAVVEGEIHHRSLAIEENAWFAGVSRPEEASASGATDPQSPVQLVPTDGTRQINGSLDKECYPDQGEFRTDLRAGDYTRKLGGRSLRNQLTVAAAVQLFNFQWLARPDRSSILPHLMHASRR